MARPIYSRIHQAVPLRDRQRESEAPLVCIDEGSDLISKGEGYALFEDGQPTPFVRQTADFLKEFHQQMERTKIFAQSLNQLGLLSEVKAATGQTGSSAISLGKARVVDERQLLELLMRMRSASSEKENLPGSMRTFYLLDTSRG